MSNTQLTAANQNNKNVHYDFQRSDLLFKTNYQKYIFILNSAYQTLLLNDKKLNKVNIFWVLIFEITSFKIYFFEKPSLKI